MNHNNLQIVPDPDRLLLAVPKGRILKELLPVLIRAGLTPEASFNDPTSRALRFCTQDPNVDLIRVRSFDVATFVAFGGAQLGVVGNDVLMEFDYDEIYAPVDLGVSRCRLSLAAARGVPGLDDLPRWSHIRIATKYPAITQCYFARHGVQAEIIKLNGAMELAPILGLCRRIVDLVQTGATLAANGLEEVAVISEISSRLAVNRPALKTRPKAVTDVIERLRMASSPVSEDILAPGVVDVGP